MPIYEFRCLECGSLFEKFFNNPEEKVEITCPKCRSASFERVISRASHIMGSGKTGRKPAVTTKSCSSGSDCVTLEIPGPGE